MTLKDKREGLDTSLDPVSGQQREYLVLSAEERAKGFVRPVRRSYVHVGIPAPQHPLRPLTEEERTMLGDSFHMFEVYPESESPATGRFWTKEELGSVDKGCGTRTTMALDLAETFARTPGFYGGTFCCGCRTHLPVGERGEFVWEGTSERVGT